MFKRPITESYPENPGPVKPRYHGRHQLNRYDDGLEKCKEALRILVSMGEFQQVLVVTHIEALADAMPHRIIVRAGADGSTAEVV